MEAGTLGEELNPWACRAVPDAADRRADDRHASSRPSTRGSSQTSDREAARNDRIHGAVGVIPTPLWLVLFFTSGLIFVYMLFFADSGERAVVQALLMGTVVSVITSMLLLLTLLDNPFHDGIGGLRPVAMERALQIIDQELKLAGASLTLPCDARGNAVDTSCGAGSGVLGGQRAAVLWTVGAPSLGTPR